MFGCRRPVHIGLSARTHHSEAGAAGLRTKTLPVLEQSVAQWAASRDTSVPMIPSALQDGALQRSSIRVRDAYELELVREFLEAGKPILGICRGIQWVIEVLRYQGRGFVFGVQWHPEFHVPGDDEQLDATPMVGAFLEAARR